MKEHFFVKISTQSIINWNLPIERIAKVHKFFFADAVGKNSHGTICNIDSSLSRKLFLCSTHNMY